MSKEKTNMETGISTSFPLAAAAARDTLSHLRSLGYDCADLQSFVDTGTEWFSLPAHELRRRWEEIGRIARDCGIRFSQTHGPWRYPPQDGTEEDRTERFGKMALAIEGTAAIGAPCMAIHNIMPDGADSLPDPDRFMDMNRDFFSRLLEKAKAAGVVIALENMPMRKLILSTPEQVLAFAREFDSPWFRVCLDTGHAAVFGLSPADEVRRIGREYLACLHVHDNDGARDLHWTPYSGVIDWEDFSRALHEIGFGGTLSLETDVSGRLPPSIRPEWEKALAATARHLAAININPDTQGA